MESPGTLRLLQRLLLTIFFASTVTCLSVQTASPDPLNQPTDDGLHPGCHHLLTTKPAVHFAHHVLHNTESPFYSNIHQPRDPSSGHALAGVHPVGKAAESHKLPVGHIIHHDGKNGHLLAGGYTTTINQHGHLVKPHPTHLNAVTQAHLIKPKPTDQVDVSSGHPLRPPAVHTSVVTHSVPQPVAKHQSPSTTKTYYSSLPVVTHFQHHHRPAASTHHGQHSILIPATHPAATGLSTVVNHEHVHSTARAKKNHVNFPGAVAHSPIAFTSGHPLSVPLPALVHHRSTHQPLPSTVMLSSEEHLALPRKKVYKHDLLPKHHKVKPVEATPATTYGHYLATGAIQDHPATASLHHFAVSSVGNPLKKHQLNDGTHHSHHVDHGGRGESLQSHHEANSGRSDKEQQLKTYEDSAGRKHSHFDDGGHAAQHHSSGGGKGGYGYKGHKGHRGSSYSKGFRDQYHKDEYKKRNKFWSNGHEQGNFEHFGKDNDHYVHVKDDKEAAEQHKADEQEDKAGKKGEKVEGHDSSEHNSHKESRGHMKKHGFQEDYLRKAAARRQHKLS